MTVSTCYLSRWGVELRDLDLSIVYNFFFFFFPSRRSVGSFVGAARFVDRPLGSGDIAVLFLSAGTKISKNKL